MFSANRHPSMRAAVLAPALTTLVLGACTLRPALEKEPAATWRAAMVFLPTGKAKEIRRVHLGNAAGWSGAAAHAGIRPDTRLPAVIHLHGCRGLDDTDSRWGAYYARRGFAFFAPDSFAREGRPVFCNRGQQQYRMALRLEEAMYAVRQLEQIEWIDTTRIVLSGFSEGAQAATSYNGKRFAGIVLLGTDCRFVGGRPRAPRSVPLINIVGSNDHYGYGAGCSVSDAPKWRKLIVGGAPHDVSAQAPAGQALAEFLLGIQRGE